MGLFRKMNIGFYRYSLLNRGGDRMVLEYANYLASVGHDVTFHLVEKSTVFNCHANISIKLVPWRSKIGFLLYGVTHNLGHDLVVVDIVHLPHVMSVRNRVVYFAQADDVEYYGGWPGRYAMDFLYRLFLRQGANVITVDESLQCAFESRYHFNGSHNVTNGIDTDTFYPELNRDLLESKDNRKAVVFMARGDHYRKGYDLALELFATIDNVTASQIVLWVCGDHLTENEFSFPVRNFGIVSDDLLRQILSSADILLYPSRHEGFGLFPLEAMACGCIPITTEAVPYAAKSDGMLVSFVGDVSGMVLNLKKIINSNEDMISEVKLKAKKYAESYDLRTSRNRFEKVLLNMSGKF